MSDATRPRVPRADRAIPLLHNGMLMFPGDATYADAVSADRRRAEDIAACLRRAGYVLTRGPSWLDDDWPG